MSYALVCVSVGVLLKTVVRCCFVRVVLFVT